MKPDMSNKIKKAMQTVYTTTDGHKFTGKGSKGKSQAHQLEIDMEDNKNVLCKRLWILFGFPSEIHPDDVYAPDPSTPLEADVGRLLLNMSDIMDNELETFRELSVIFFRLFTKYPDQMSQMGELVNTYRQQLEIKRGE